MKDNLSQALDHAQRGWYVFPCRLDKTPLTKHGKNDATIDPEKIRLWWTQWPDALIGIYCEKSGFFAVDLDKKPGVNGALEWNKLVETYGGGRDVIPSPVQRTIHGGLHVLFALPANMKIPNNAGKLAPGIDLRSNGYICTGGPYTWLPGHGPETILTQAPAWLLELVRNVHKKQNGHKPEQVANTPDIEVGNYWLRVFLKRVIPGNRNQSGFDLACQLRDSGLCEAQAEHIMKDYAARVPGDGYTEREALASLKSAYRGDRREPAHIPGLSIGNNNHHWVADSDQFRVSEQPKTPPSKYRLDDIGNGERLVARHGDKLRFVQEWGWLTWTGSVWNQDRGMVASWAKETARSIYAEAAACQDPIQAAELAKHARLSASRSRREAMLEAAASEPGIQAAPEDFDRDPWLLNVENGILNLQTGQLQPHCSQALITKIAGVHYDPAATCPEWLKFLNRIFCSNATLIRFLQQAIGYSLSGKTGEQCLFFLYGSGANGKTTFTGVIQDLMGDYAMKTRAETLMVKRNDSIPEEVAQIAGIRFLLGAELGEGERLNEALVKDLTGGDRLRGRLLYHKSFEFVPVAKTWLYGNHKPMVKGTDEGIWRRVKLIPFTVTIPEAERDGSLPEILRRELPGILNWAMQGCLSWQREGLQVPDEVKAATASYRAEQDILAAFLEERCIISVQATATAGALYEDYKKWAEECGIHPSTKIAFSRQLTERGFTPNKRQSGTGRALYVGLGLVTKDESL